MKNEDVKTKEIRTKIILEGEEEYAEKIKQIIEDVEELSKSMEQLNKSMKEFAELRSKLF